VRDKEGEEKSCASERRVEVAAELRTGYNAVVYLLFAPFFTFFCTLFTIQSPNWNSKYEKNKFNGFENFLQIRKSKKMI
jgi:hypothetical protein